MKTSFLTKLSQNWQPGITVGLVSIPVAISLAVATNVSPIAGIITTIWAGLAASIFGGSNYNIIGPAGALAGLLAAYSALLGPESLPMLALASGIFMYIGYLLRIERYLIFIPGSALHGFILGIAGIIIIGQLPAILGLEHLPRGNNTFGLLYNALTHATQAYLPAVGLFSTMLFGLVFCTIFTPRIPGAIALTPIAIFIGYLAQTGSLPWHFHTLGTKYGAFPSTLFNFPNFHFRLSYLLPAFVIAAISVMETLVSARIADGITKTRFHKRNEVRGLSFANIISGLVGGIPSAAALARTTLNIRSGATDKISATISSLCVIVISLLCLPWLVYFPLPAIAAILVFVSFRMLEAKHFWHLFKVDKKHFALALIVACVSMYEDPAFGILFGSVAAMLMFMEKLSRGFHETELHATSQPKQHVAPNKHTLIYKIKGPLVYINAQSHCDQLEHLPTVYTHIVIDIHNVHFIDADGADTLLDTIQYLQDSNRCVYIAGILPIVEHFLNEHKPYHDLKNGGKVLPHINDALATINNSSI